jgi:predicted nucleic acid-binding protein
VVTIGELRKGVDQLVDGRRKRQLDRWLSVDLPDRFEGRLLPVDVPVADAWGSLLSAGERRGTSVGSVDAMIAATARVHELQVITRNVTNFSPFVPLGVPVRSPWD